MSPMPDSRNADAFKIGLEEYRPDEVTHPGELLRAELADRGMSQVDFAVRAGLSTKHVNQVLKGSAVMSSDVAVTLERVLGTPASVWTNVEARWQENRSRQQARNSLTEHVGWAQQFPLAALSARGFLATAQASEEAVEALLRFFRVASPASFNKFWIESLSGSFRRAQQFKIDEYETVSWLRIAEHQTEHHDLPPFSVTRLRTALPELRQLTQLPQDEGFRRARKVLSRCGVALTFVEALPKSRIGGATWWPALNRPIIALSERHRRADIFWFTMFHEIAHLLLHPRRTAFIDLVREKGSVDDDFDGSESQANDLAADTLIPRMHNDYIAHATGPQLIDLADSLGVGVCILAGRKARLTGNYRSVSCLREALDVAKLRSAEESALNC